MPHLIVDGLAALLANGTVVRPHLDVTLDANGSLIHVQIEKRLDTDAAADASPNEKLHHKLAWMIFAARVILNDS